MPGDFGRKKEERVGKLQRSKLVNVNICVRRGTWLAICVCLSVCACNYLLRNQLVNKCWRGLADFGTGMMCTFVHALISSFFFSHCVQYSVAHGSCKRVHATESKSIDPENQISCHNFSFCLLFPSTFKARSTVVCLGFRTLLFCNAKLPDNILTACRSDKNEICRRINLEINETWLLLFCHPKLGLALPFT